MENDPKKEKKKPGLQPLKQKMGLGAGSTESTGQRPVVPEPGALANKLLPPDIAPMTLGQNPEVQDDMTQRFKNRRNGGQ